MNHYLEWWSDGEWFSVRLCRTINSPCHYRLLLFVDLLGYSYIQQRSVFVILFAESTTIQQPWFCFDEGSRTGRCVTSRNWTYILIDVYMVCYVFISFLLSQVMIPNYHPILIKWLLTLDTLWNTLIYRRTAEITTIYLWKIGWIVVLPTLIMKSCWERYGNVPTHIGSMKHCD